MSDAISTSLPSSFGLPPRRVAESQITMSQVMMPGDANLSGNVHGGVIMKLVDTAAGVCAIRHARRRTVTARIDSMSFLQPVYIGDLVTLRASVNDVGRTSLEVGVRVEAENLLTGVIRHVSSAYLVFVVLDEQGQPTPAPPLVAESDVERRRMSEAQLRRSHRQRGEEAMRALRDADSARASLAAWRRPGSAVVVVGHRGAAGHAPENTLPSFEAALDLGADAVELDVHLSRDGIPVVIHDHTVERTTNGHGVVAQMTVHELKELDAGGGGKIPTLDEVLRWARGRTRVVIELKGTENPNLVPATLERVREYGLVEDALLISFDHLAIKLARTIESRIRTGALYFARLVDASSIAIASGADALCPQWSTLDARTIAEARAAGLAVCGWTANEPDDVRAALALGIDGLTSDYPDRVRASERECR
jgi:glycerophosphoryl diester phosphodiesterase